MAHTMSSDDDDSRQMFGNYGSESKIKTSGGDEPYSPSAPTDPTDTWSPKGLAKHMSAYSDIFEDPEVDPTEGSSSGSGGAKPKNTLKPRSTSMSDNRSPPRGGSSGVKRKSDDLSDSDSDDDDGHLQEDSDGDSDSSDSSPSAATCAICLGKMRGEVGSPNVCEHTFCFECILEWSNNNATCPQDRKKFNLILVRQNLGGPIVSELKVEQPEEAVPVVEENPTYCEVCAQCDREDRLLLCDGCDMGYHLECLSPALSTVPIEEWYCPVCVADQPQSAGSSSWEQRSMSQAGPSSSSSGSRGSRSSQSSRSRENRGSNRGQRLIPRTQAAERLRLKIVKKKKAKKAEKRRKKHESRKKVKTHENDIKLHRWGKESEGADVDSLYNSDDEATKILENISRQNRVSHLHAKERQEEKRANAAKVIRDGFFIPRPSYAGAKTSVVTRVASAPQPTASVDILGDIFESQAIAFGSSKDITITEDRKLLPKDPKKFEEGSVAKEIPLPSHKSSKSNKEGTHSPSRSSKSKYKSSPRSSKRSPSPKSSKRSLSPRNPKRSPSPRSSKRSPSPKISKRSPSPRNSKRSSSPKNSKRSPSPKSSKHSSSPRSSRRSPPRGHYKRTPSPKGYKKRSPSPKIRKSSQDYKREYSSRTERPRDDKYYSPLESRKKSPPKMSYGRPVSSNRHDRDRRRSFSPEERGYKADYKKGKHFSPKHRQSKGSRSPETVFYDRQEREKSPNRKDKSRDGYRDLHKGDKGYEKKDRSPQRKDRSPYREKSPLRRDHSPIRERSPQRKERSPFKDRSPRRRELTPRREATPIRSHKITSHVSRSRERSLGREKKVRERSQWSHSYFSSNGNDVNKSNTNSYSVHSVHNVQSSSKSQKGEISKQDSSQDSSDEKSKTSRSSSKESSSSDSTSDSSSSETEKNSEDEASEQLSLHSVGNLMMALKNKKTTIIDKGTNKQKSKKEKDSKGKIKKVSSQLRVPENIKRKSIKDAITVSDETEEDEQPIQTINKLKVEPRSSKLKSSSKDKERKRKKHSKRRHKSSSSSSSSNNSESDSSDTEESDKEKSKGKFKNIESQKVKGKIKDDLEGPSSIGEKKISISLKDNFSIKINKKNALGVEEEPTKKLSGLPIPVKEVEVPYSYFNPYEKKRVSHYAPPEEKQKAFEIEKKPASSLFERTSAVVAAANEVKVKEKPKKVSVKPVKQKSVPSIPLPDEKLVREAAIRNNIIKDLIEENDIIKDAFNLQGSDSQIKDAIKGVIGRKTDKSSIKVRSDVVKNPVIGVHDVKKSIHTSIPSKSIPTIPLPLDAPKKKEESDDEIEEVWRKAVPGSSRRRSGDIKMNLLTDKARNNGKSKGQAEIKDDDIIGIQVSKKKDDSHDLLNKIKKQTNDEDKSKNKNEIKKLSEINQDKKPYKSENKEKDKYQSQRDSIIQVDGKQSKGTPKKETPNLYTEKKSDIPGLDLISPKKRDSLDIELPTERKRTFSRSFGSDDFDFGSTSFDYSKNLDSEDKTDFKATSFNINKFIDGEMGKQSKEDRDLLKRQKREMEKERKVAECLKAFHRHKGVLDSEDEQEFKDSTDDLILDRKEPKQTEKIEKRRSSAHGLVDKFVLQNNPDMKDNSEDEDKPYSPTEDKPYSPTQDKPYSPTQDKPYSPTQNKPYSPTQNKPYSPTQNKPYSPTQNKPYSPTQSKPYSPTQSAHLESDPEVEEDVPYSPSQHVPDEPMPVPKSSSPGPPNKRLQTAINKGLLESKVIEEVKKYLDPYYRDKTFNREQYKQIVSKCVDKVVNVECGYVIEPNKMHKLVDGYVKLFKHRIKKDRMLKL